MKEELDITNGIEDLVRKINDEISLFLKTEFDVENKFINIKFEKLFRKWMQAGREEGDKKVCAKQYVGIIAIEKGKDLQEITIEKRIEIKGFAARRSDKSPYTKTMVKDFLLKVLLEDKETVISWLHEEYKKILRGGVEIERLGIPVGLRKHPNEYKNKPQHLKAIEYSNKYLGKNFGRDDKGQLYFVRAVAGKPETDAVVLEWGEKPSKDMSINMPRMIERSLIMPTRFILKSIYNYDWKIITSSIKTLDYF